MPLATYTSDGRFDAAALPRFFLYSMPFSAILAVLYQSLSFFMPCVGAITAIVVVFYCILMMALLEQAGRAARNRSKLVHLALGFLVSGFAYYVCWATLCTWLVRGAPNPPAGLASIVWNPVDMAYLVPRFAEVGYTTGSSSSGGGTSVSGTFLWIVWAVEAICIFILPPFLSMDYTTQPFYPTTNSWGTKRKGAKTYAGDGVPQTRDDFLADTRFAWLEKLRPTDAPALGTLGFEFTEQEKEDLAYLTITRGVEKVENKKKVIKQEPFVKYIELTPDLRKRIGDAFALIDTLAPDSAADVVTAAATADKDDAEDEAIDTAPTAAPAAKPSLLPAAKIPAAPAPEEAPDPRPSTRATPGGKTQNVGDEWDQ